MAGRSLTREMDGSGSPPVPHRFHFHQATPSGEGGVAVFEVYGGAPDVLRALFHPRGGALPGPGEARLGSLVGRDGKPIDEALLALVPPAGMWCGLEAWTLSVHGGIWIQRAALAALADRGGRELDREGVLALSVSEGALDAVQAAAYELLVTARTAKAARFFARQREGELSGTLREAIAAAGAGDLPGTIERVDRILAGAPAAIRLGTPLRVLLAGRPNSGKSTLFNRLVEDERAVVTPIPGTTRDANEEAIAIGGFPVIVADSPGLRSLGEVGEVERLGIEAVLERRDDAVLYLVSPPWSRSQEDDAFIARLPPDRVLLLATFADVEDGEAPAAALRISGLRGDGIDLLRSEVRRRWLDGRASESDSGADDMPCAAFTEEQVHVLRQALDRARDIGEKGARLDGLRAASMECLRSSWQRDPST